VLEIEVKLKIDDLDFIRGKLERSGAALFKARHFEHNLLYDLPESALFRKRCALRLRKVGNKAFLTFKGPHLKSRKFKVREEFETEVKNPQHMQKILRALGFRIVFRYQKYRTVYRKKKLIICIDETPIGNFIELEGERNHIVRFAESLGFTKPEFIKTDYIAMLKEAGMSGGEGK